MCFKMFCKPQRLSPERVDQMAMISVLGAGGGTSCPRCSCQCSVMFALSDWR